MLNVTIGIHQTKASGKAKRRRNRLTAARVKQTLCQLGMNGFLSQQQVEMLILLWGLQNV